MATVEIPVEITERFYGLRNQLFGYDLRLKPEVREWCKKNKIKPSRPWPLMNLSGRRPGDPTNMVFRAVLIPPYHVEIRNPKKAALFKIFWC